MKTSPILLLAIAAGISGMTLHAAPAPPTAEQWKAALDAREQRANLLRDELKALDARIEGRIDGLINALRSIGDSKDSVSKVARMKMETVDSLTKTLGYYQTKRAALQEELRRPTLRLTEEQKRKGIAAFDAHIEKRVAQILAIQKSLPAHKDYKNNGNNWNGNMSQDDLHKQRLASYTNSQRKEIEAGLRSSIARLEQQNRTLRAQNAPAAEIAKNDALIAERRNQIATTLLPGATKTQKVGLQEAMDLDKALKTAIVELRKDFNTLFARYNAYLQELAAVNQTRDALAAVKPKTP